MTLTERIISLVPDIEVYEEGETLPDVRPITLADVLMAIEKFTNEYTISVDQDGFFWVIKSERKAETTGIQWNLATDLDNQSEECRTFISKILGV